MGEVDESEKHESMVTVDVELRFDSVLINGDGVNRFGIELSLARLGSMVSMLLLLDDLNLSFAGFSNKGFALFLGFDFSGFVAKGSRFVCKKSLRGATRNQMVFN